MNNQSLKEVADNLKEKEGQVRGEKFLTHARYIRENEGEEGVVAVKEKMKELGHPFEFDKAVSLKWYPVGYSPLVIVIAKEIFNWSDDRIFDMGASAVKFSFFFKMALRYIVSINKLADNCPSHWRKYYTIGDIRAIGFDEEKKQIIAEIKDFDVHPVMCFYLQGYILQMLRYVIKGTDISIREIMCVHKGGSHEEYLITWK